MSDATPRPSDPSEVGNPPLTRRSLLLSGAAGVAAAYGLTASKGSAALSKASGTVTFGSNYSNAIPKKALQTVFDKFTAKSGIKVEVNTVDHEAFQEQINSYLQGRPDDVFSWFAGYRMQFFAQRGLASPIDDVWQGALSRQMSPALKAASTGLDGHQYFVPFYYYPWAVFYRRSVFAEKGYKAPKTWDQYVALAKKMKEDGLNPIAFADKQGWPAMGTFDYLNMRINGYDFHVRLMAGKEPWESAKVKNVFNTWREILPLSQPGALGRRWEDAGASVARKESGMYLLGMFVGQVFLENGKQGAIYRDLDFFPFPQINPKWGQDSVEAPIDGFMLSKSPKNSEAAKELLKYFGTSAAQLTYLGSDPNNIATNKTAPTTRYSPLQKKAVKLVNSVKHISQYLDRDTRPDFASTVMIPALQQFIRKPDDVNGLVKSIERQKKAIFGQ